MPDNPTKTSDRYWDHYFAEVADPSIDPLEEIISPRGASRSRSGRSARQIVISAHPDGWDILQQFVSWVATPQRYYDLVHGSYRIPKLAAKLRSMGVKGGTDNPISTTTVRCLVQDELGIGRKR